MVIVYFIMFPHFILFTPTIYASANIKKETEQKTFSARKAEKKGKNTQLNSFLKSSFFGLTDYLLNDFRFFNLFCQRNKCRHFLFLGSNHLLR